MLVWMLERDAGARLKTASFKSGSDAILQVGGHAQFSTENLSEGHGLLEAKKLRVLAVTSKSAAGARSDAPTLVERIQHQRRSGARLRDAGRRAGFGGGANGVDARARCKSAAWKVRAEEHVREHLDGARRIREAPRRAARARERVSAGGGDCGEIGARLLRTNVAPTRAGSFRRSRRSRSAHSRRATCARKITSSPSSVKVRVSGRQADRSRAVVGQLHRLPHPVRSGAESVPLPNESPGWRLQPPLV